MSPPKKICWSPNTPIPQNVALCEDKVSKNELTRVDPNPMRLVSLEKEEFGHEDRYMQRDDSMKRRREKAAVCKARGEAVTDPHLTALWRNQPCWPLGLGYLAPRTVIQYIPPEATHSACHASLSQSKRRLPSFHCHKRISHLWFHPRQDHAHMWENLGKSTQGTTNEKQVPGSAFDSFIRYGPEESWGFFKIVSLGTEQDSFILSSVISKSNKGGLYL